MKIYNTSTISNCIKKAAVLASEKSKTNKNVIVFAEDKITLSLEFEIAKLLNGGFMNIDVCTFKRYISQRSSSSKVLSKESSAMAVRKLILENKDEFYCFKNSILKPNLPITLYELISQLKSAKVEVNDLKDIIDNKAEILSLALLHKIKDIYTIYKKYSEYLLENSLLDSNDYLLTMKELVKEDKTLKDAYVLLVGFSTITKQRAEIIEEINKLCSGVDAVVIKGKNGEFYTGEITEKLLKIVKDSKEFYDESPLSEDGEILKKNLYNLNIFKEDFKKFNTKNISLYEAYSPKEEVENIAQDILFELRKNNKRFKDISISVGDLDSYLPVLRKVFNEYEIPYFVDKNRALIDHPLCEYILSYLQLVRRGFCREDFIKFVSNPLFCGDKNLTDNLVEYLLKYSLNRNNLKTPFKESHEDLESLEKLRNLAYNAFKLFENAITVDDFVLNVRKMLQMTNALENIDLLSQKLKEINALEHINFNQKAFEKVNDILDEITFLLKGLKLPILDFANILSSGMSATNVGGIPLYNDAVYIASIKDVKIKSVDILYAMGLNGEIPFSQSDTSILTDSDLYELDNFKVIVEPKIRVVNLRERENVCLSLLSFNQKLKVSCSDTTANGKAVQKSEIIKYISSIFNIKPLREISGEFNSDNALKTSIKYSNDHSSLREIAKNSILYNNGNEKAISEIACFYSAINKEELSYLKDSVDNILSNTNKDKSYIDENLVKNYNNNNISATVLENYFACPYSNYAKNVLRLKDSQTGEVKPFETGNMLHNVMQKYILSLDKVKDKESSDKQVEEIFNEILTLEENKKLVNNTKFTYLGNALLNESKRVCFECFKQLSNSKFKPYLVEQSFGDNSKYGAITLKSPNGEFKLKGKVDRVDRFENSIRIIDYKTGEIKANDESFYTGNKLQLYLYMNAFIKDGLTPSGAYYFPINDEYSDKDNNPYKMQGKTLNDKDILSATDKDIFETLKGNSTGIRIKNEGEPYANSPILLKEEMNSYLDYAIKVSENGIKEFTSGYIKPSPYQGNCKYCNYNAMCGFFSGEKAGDMENEGEESLSSPKERKEKGVKSSTIVNAVKNSQGGKVNE